MNWNYVEVYKLKLKSPLRIHFHTQFHSPEIGGKFPMYINIYSLSALKKTHKWVLHIVL